MKKLSTLLAWLFLLSLTSISPASANDDALYDAPIPPDKSLIRFLNAEQAPGLSLDFSGQAFPLGTDPLSNYKVVTGGQYKIAGNGASIDYKFEPKKFYTVIVGGKAAGLPMISVVEDKVAQNRSGSSINFYNVTASPADLAVKLKGKSKNVFTGVKPGGEAFREIIPVDLGIDVMAAGKVVKSFDKVSLSATDRQNIVATLVGSEVRAFVVTTAIDR